MKETPTVQNLGVPIITSLDPIRPANSPDDWEEKALEKIDPGESISAQTCCLVVEDNLINRRVTNKLLQSFGLTIDNAEDGYEALAKLKKAMYMTSYLWIS